MYAKFAEMFDVPVVDTREPVSIVKLALHKNTDDKEMIEFPVKFSAGADKESVPMTAVIRSKPM
jgi:hypothetical protein